MTKKQQRTDVHSSVREPGPDERAPSSHDILHALVDALEDRHAVIDSSGSYRHRNAAWLALEHEKNLAGRTTIPAALFDHCGRNGTCDGALAVQAGLELIQSGRQDSFALEYGCVDGTTERWFSVQARSLPADLGCMLVTYGEITQRKRSEEAIRHMAYHDPLTGLANRRLFREHADHVLSVAKRNFQNVGVVTFDLDGFKEVNDTHGHELGDELLVAMARRLEEIFRATDVVARFGGDEFAVLLPNIKIEEVMEVLERCRVALELPYRLKGTKLKVTASIGVSFFPLHATNMKRLLRLADEAMYVAKERRLGIAIAGANDAPP